MDANAPDADDVRVERHGGEPTDVRVLLIGGDPVIECSVELLLTAHHLRIAATAADGLGAARALQESRPTVAVLDLALGDEALTCVRILAQAAPELPILTFGGRRAWPLQEFLDAGVKGFALTTSEPEAFVAAIRTVAAGGSYLDPGFSVADRGAHRREGRPVLSAREREVMHLLAHGLSSAEVAERLHISHPTVRTHLQNAMRKLGARTRAHAIGILAGTSTGADDAQLPLAG